MWKQSVSGLPQVGRRTNEKSAAVSVNARLTCNICCAVTLWREQFRFPLAVFPNLAYSHGSLEAQVAAVLVVEPLHLVTARHVHVEGPRQVH